MNKLDWDEILSRLSQLATSQGAREQLGRLAPLDTPKEAQESFIEISEAVQVLQLGRAAISPEAAIYHQHGNDAD